MRRLNLSVVLVLFVLIAAPRIATAQLDRVYPKGGIPVSGTVLSMTTDAVVMDVRGAQKSFQVNQIQKVAYGDDPATLASARDRIIQGQLEAGLESLKTLDPNSISRKVVQQDVVYYRAFAEGKLALSGGGDKKAAAGAMYAFVRANSSSFHFYEAAELLGDLALAIESYENATKYYGALARAPWDDYKLRSAILMAGAFLAQGDFPKALEQYDNVLASNVDTREVQNQKQFALVGKSMCLAQTGNPTQGITAIHKIIADNDPNDAELFARAYNALGTCYVYDGKPKDALLAFLHVHVLYYSNPDLHAEALYHLSKLWQQVNQADRAVKAKGMLTSRYAGTVWAKKK